LQDNQSVNSIIPIEKGVSDMEAAVKKESMKIVPPGKKKCVWMEAGVVSYKLCDNNYDCPTCQYDHAMQAKVARQRAEIAPARAEAAPDILPTTWVEKMMQLPASRRKCRYMLTGEIGRKICPNAYECGSCSFDQMMQERIQAEPLPAQAQAEVGGFRVAGGYYYHEGHTWARPEYGGRVRVGMDDFAQKLLGAMSGIEPPSVGQEIRQGDVGIRIRKDGELAQLLSPIDGIVTHVNPAVMNSPWSVNQSPYEQGWLFIVEPSKLRKNLKDLYYGDEAVKYFGEERDRLLSTLHPDMALAADGGDWVGDIFDELERAKWRKVVKTFLRI